MAEEKFDGVSISAIASQLLDKSQVFAYAKGPDSEKHNAKVNQLRALFAPMLIYLFDEEQSFESQEVTPERIIDAIAARPELQEERELMQQVVNRFGGSSSTSVQRDWFAEADDISRKLDDHPLKKLSDAVRQKMSEKARAELGLHEF